MPSSRGLFAFVPALALSFLVCSVAQAETSAADKSAARQVATEGIQFFKSEKYAEALDRMRRAQALYDAPVHLLYIARAEAKLGQLVEASEHYRQLDHYTLPANPPEAWSAAVDDGRKELASVEPRIPKLRVMTEPEVPTATLRIDGADVSSAAVGIPRPINPGKHHVELATPGQPWSSADVDVAEGTTRDVVFRVQPGGAAAPKVTTGVVASNATEPREPEAAGAPPKDGPFVGFLGGLRLGVAVPTGTVFAFSQPESVGSDVDVVRDVATSEVSGPGGAIEFQAGIRLGKYFTPVFFLAGQALSHPATFRMTQGTLAIDAEIKAARAGTFGIGLRVGTPPGKLGLFGEFGIGLYDVMSVELGGLAATAGNCKVNARGSSIRLGGGGVIPVVKWLQITPLAMVSLGQFTDLDLIGCTFALPKDIPSADQRTHGMIFLGVGGDVIIGGRR